MAHLQKQQMLVVVGIRRASPVVDFGADAQIPVEFEIWPCLLSQWELEVVSWLVRVRGSLVSMSNQVQ